VLSGVFEGKTTGMPVCLIIRNKDQRPAAYEKIKAMFRPGHAGYTYLAKYGIADDRGGGRSSGRETVARVAAGALAKEFLSARGIEIIGHTVEVAGIRARSFDRASIEQNPLRCADMLVAEEMERAVMQARDEGDSVGGIVEVIVRGVPAGLGEPVFDKLNADLAHALMSIGAVKGVEFGNGFAAARLKGSENNDPMYADTSSGRIRTRTNNAGGMAGGISNGEDLLMRIAVKPTSSIRKEQETVTVDREPARISVHGRHDPCICPRIVPVAESMVALTLMDHLTRQRLMRGKKTKPELRDTFALIDQDVALLKELRKRILPEIGKRSRRV
ncbi:MAG: chorismate synthase, partial [Bacteroidetes bacterium]|nr:chorismate synthase [Bacteroidota bacterium]